MRFYLSSFKAGERSSLLPFLYGGGPVGYVANALDHVSDQNWLNDWIASDIEGLAEIGVQAQRFDLRDFFAPNADIGPVVSALSGIWISGGNVFVLRQAMKLSGLDAFLIGESESSQFVYGGYSAAACVLAPSLKPYALVDDPEVHPYPQSQTTIWEGLGVLDFAFMPHFQSQHSESELIDKEIAYCEEHGVAYRVFRDGEVLIF
jgi:dipeptidase E